MAVDGPKIIKVILSPNSVRLASNRVIKKYRKQRQKGSLKKKKKSAEWLKKAVFLALDDLETIDFNNDTQITDLTDIDKMDLKHTSATQQAAKKA